MTYQKQIRKLARRENEKLDRINILTLSNADKKNAAQSIQKKETPDRTNTHKSSNTKRQLQSNEMF